MSLVFTSVKPTPTPAPTAPAAESVVETPAREVAVEPDGGGALTMEPYIDTELCTSCDDCLKINNKLFVYNADNQAYIADPSAGTFKQVVMAAEACPAEIIHPGTPLNPKEKNLDKLIVRAERFN